MKDKALLAEASVEDLTRALLLHKDKAHLPPVLVEALKLVRGKTSEALATATVPESSEPMNYASLAIEFKREKPTGKAAILWMAEKGIIPEWAEGNFKGARQALPALSGKSRTQFVAFYKEAFGKTMSPANDNSPFSPEFFLMDAHVAYDIMGEDHFSSTVQPNLINIRDKYREANETEGKALIEGEFGLKVDSWNDLPGLRYSDGSAVYRDALCALGAPDDHYADDLWLVQHDSNLLWSYRDFARLCLLA